MNAESISMEAHKDIVIQILFSFLAAVFLFSAGTRFFGVKKVVDMFSLFKLSTYRHFAGIVETLSALLLLYPHTQILGSLVASCYLGACFLPGLQFNKLQVVIPSAGAMLIVWAVVMLKIHFVRHFNAEMQPPSFAILRERSEVGDRSTNGSTRDCTSERMGLTRSKNF